MTRRRHINFKGALTSAWAAASLLAPFGASAATEVTEQFMDCQDVVVRYAEPSLVPLEGHVSIQRLKQRPGQRLNEYGNEYVPDSPQMTAAFNRVVTVSTKKPGPRGNVIEVFSTKGEAVAWQIEAEDLVEDMRLQWLNEDLLFIRAWWGRIVSTDLIFQLSSGRFIYAQEANYGLLVQPCEERVKPGKAQRQGAMLPGDG